MDWTSILVVLHVLIALGIIGLVLLQHGRGADMGSGFGGGSSGSLFGASGSANFLSRTTAVLATVFFISSLGLAYLATNKPHETGASGVMERASAKKAEPEKPAAEAPKPAAPQPKDVPQ
jgi:preprotein translocase subunit SecG